MDDMFSMGSIGRDLLGLGKQKTSAAWSSGPWGETGEFGALGATGAKGLDMSGLDSVENQLKGIDYVVRSRAVQEGQSMRVTLTLGWLHEGRRRLADVDVVVTAGSSTVVIAGQTYQLARPAMLFDHGMFASPELGTKVKDIISREPERQDERRQQMELRDGAGAVSWPGTERTQAGNGLGGRPAGDYGLNMPPIPEFKMPDLTMGTTSPMPELSDKALADARRTEELRKLGMAPVRELLRAPDGAPPTEFNYHAGVLDVVYGRNRIRFTINTTTGAVVIGGKVQFTKRPAERVGGTAMVSGDVLDLAKAADAAAASSGFALRARAFDGLNLLRGSNPAASAAPGANGAQAPSFRLVDRYNLERAAMLDPASGPAPALRLLGMEFGINDFAAPSEQQVRFMGGELRAAADSLMPWNWLAGGVEVLNSLRDNGLFATAGTMIWAFVDGLNPLDEEDPAEGGGKFMSSVITAVTMMEGGGRATKLGKAYWSGEWQMAELPAGQYAWQGRHLEVVLDEAKNAVLTADGEVKTKWRAFRSVRMTPRAGDTIYRVGGEWEFPWTKWHENKDYSHLVGECYARVDPRTSPDFRCAAGLPDENNGRFLVGLELHNPELIEKILLAAPVPGRPGGWPEWRGKVWMHPDSYTVKSVWGLNPPFGDWGSRR